MSMFQPGMELQSQSGILLYNSIQHHSHHRVQLRLPGSISQRGKSRIG